MKSWKTTVLGITAAVTAVCDGITALLDGDAATNPDWVLLGAVLSTAIGLIFSRDNGVTSEQAGAKK